MAEKKQPILSEEQVVEEILKEKAKAQSKASSKPRGANTDRTPCVAYDFRDEESKVVEGLKEDSLMLKKELLKTDFNTLALRQLGVEKRMFAIRVGKDVRVFANALIMGRAGGAVVMQREEMKPKDAYIALRPQQIRLGYINEKGEGKETLLEGIAAAEAMKQVEREEGLYLWDIGKKCNGWDKMSDVTRANFVREYLEELAELADSPKTEAQEKYVEKKDEIKQELEKAKRDSERKERARQRQVVKDRDSKLLKHAWLE